MVSSTILAMGTVVGATVFGAYGSLLLKYGAENFGLNLKALLDPKLIVGLGIYGFTSVAFIIALKFADLSLLYPITSLSYVWISFLSIKYLNEKMNSLKWIGILLIMTGVALIGLGS